MRLCTQLFTSADASVRSKAQGVHVRGFVGVVVVRWHLCGVPASVRRRKQAEEENHRESESERVSD